MFQNVIFLRAASNGELNLQAVFLLERMTYILVSKALWKHGSALHLGQIMINMKVMTILDTFSEMKMLFDIAQHA